MRPKSIRVNFLGIFEMFTFEPQVEISHVFHIVTER